MKNSTFGEWNEYLSGCSEADMALLRDFFGDFRPHCALNKEENRKLREDFERAILWYVKSGVPLSEALERLDMRQLGGFYARPPVLWFALDDAAKIYPLSMEHGRMTLFRLSVYMKEDIQPPLLQMALNFTIKRFPSFATTLKRGFFWHYLDTAKRRFCADEEHDIPCQPLKVSASGSQSFRVLYYQNRISVEFFHVLTDGTGGMTFLKVLVAEYVRLLGVEVTPDDTLWDVNATPSTEEFENRFASVPQSADASGFVDKSAVQMTGRLSVNKPCQILHFKMNVGELKAVAKRHDATVTAYMLAQMFLAGRSATDELQGDFSIQLPVNMRKFYPSKTMRNFSMYCGIRLPMGEICDIESILPAIREQMAEKTSKEAMSEMLTATERLVGMLKWVPLAVKQPAAKLVYGFLGDKIFSTDFSNLGVVKLPPAVAEQVESFDFVLGTGISNRLTCAMVSFGECATFSITKTTADPSFEEKLYELLTSDGVTVSVEGSELYEN